MKVPSDEQLKGWMRQWRHAAEKLPALEREELRNLTSDQLLARIDAVLGLALDPAYRDRERWATSGLVQQQALFRRLRLT